MAKVYKKTLTIHMVVQNEERWVWYALMSVIDYADQLLIFDTGSTDKTVEIIKTISENPKYKDKIIFEEKGKLDRKAFVKVRDEQVQRTKTDFFMIVDGDEVHYASVMKKLREVLDECEVDSAIFPFICCAQDVKHYRDPRNEHYCFEGCEGAYNLRVVSMHIPGIHCGDAEGIWDGYYDGNGVCIDPGENYRGYYVPGFYLHMSNMLRSADKEKDVGTGWPSNRAVKYKTRCTWDFAFPEEMAYPEVFYIEHPDIVHNAWERDPGMERKVMQLLKSLLLIVRRPKKGEFFYEEGCYNTEYSWHGKPGK